MAGEREARARTRKETTASETHSAPRLLRERQGRQRSASEESRLDALGRDRAADSVRAGRSGRWVCARGRGRGGRTKTSAR